MRTAKFEADTMCAWSEWFYISSLYRNGNTIIGLLVHQNARVRRLCTINGFRRNVSWIDPGITDFDDQNFDTFYSWFIANKNIIIFEVYIVRERVFLKKMSLLLDLKYSTINFIISCNVYCVICIRTPLKKRARHIFKHNLCELIVHIHRCSR